MWNGGARLAQLVSEFVARAGDAGFTVEELKEQLNDQAEANGKRGRLR